MRRVLSLASICYLIVSVWGAVIALERVMPHSLFGGGSDDSIERDAWIGWGTALSPPAVGLAVVLLAAIVAGYGASRGWAGFLVVLVVAGLAHALYQDVVRDTLGDLGTDTVLSTLVAVQLSSALLVALLGTGIALGDRVSRPA